jgi:hypothetical protein
MHDPRGWGRETVERILGHAKLYTYFQVVEFLGKFKAIFETTQGYQSEDLVSYFVEEKTGGKSQETVPI